MGGSLLRKAVKAMLKPNRCYSPDVARALADKKGPDIPAAIYVQHLAFWSDKGRRADGWFYKSSKEIEAETGLSDNQQDRIRARAIQLGIIETKVMLAPSDSGRMANTTHFRYHEDKLIDLMIDAFGQSLIANDCVSPETTETNTRVWSETTETVLVESTDAPRGVSVEITETSLQPENTFSENTTRNNTGTQEETNARPSGADADILSSTKDEETPPPAATASNSPADVKLAQDCYPVELLQPGALHKPSNALVATDFTCPCLALAHWWSWSRWKVILAPPRDPWARFYPVVEETLSRLAGLAKTDGHNLAWVLDTYLQDDDETRDAVARQGVKALQTALRQVLNDYLDRPSAADREALAEQLGEEE